MFSCRSAFLVLHWNFIAVPHSISRRLAIPQKSSSNFSVLGGSNKNWSGMEWNTLEKHIDACCVVILVVLWAIRSKQTFWRLRELEWNDLINHPHWIYYLEFNSAPWFPPECSGVRDCWLAAHECVIWIEGNTVCTLHSIDKISTDIRGIE